MPYSNPHAIASPNNLSLKWRSAIIDEPSLFTDVEVLSACQIRVPAIAGRCHVRYLEHRYAHVDAAVSIAACAVASVCSVFADANQSTDIA